MKSRSGESLSVLCAILITVASLGYSIVHGWWLNNEMVQMSEVNQRIFEHMDYFEALKIHEKLSSQRVNIFLCKWRDCANNRGFVDRSSDTPPEYEVNKSGSDLVNAIEPGLFQWLAERRDNHPKDKIKDILSAVNMRELHRALYEYNKEHDTKIHIEMLIGVLVAHLAPSAVMS